MFKNIDIRMLPNFKKEKKSCMLKCCISKFYNIVTICHKRNISPWVQLWWGLLFLSTEYYSRAAVTWTLRGNERQFRVSREFKLLESLLKKDNKMYQHTPPLQAMIMHHSEASPKSQSMRTQSYLRRFTVSVFPKEGAQECLLGLVQTPNFP